MTYSNEMIILVTFLTASSLVAMVAIAVVGRRTRLEERLSDLSGRLGSPTEQVEMAQFARTALPKVGQMLVPTDEKERTQLTTRLIHAGLYSPQAMPVFFGVKLLLIVAPALVGLAASTVGLVTFQE